MKRATLLLCLFALASPLIAASQLDPRIENLRTFVKLYGYVRFFHPSDEASSIDWNRFAVYGSRRVSQVGPGDDPRPTFQSLFLPIAPAAQFLPAGQSPAPLPTEIAPGLDLVAWQHVGVGLGVPGPYRSARLNRKSEAAAGHFGSVTQRVPGQPYRGREIRLSASVKADVPLGGQAQLWLRVDRPNRAMGFFDNMGDRPIMSPAWGRYEIVGKVADDAEGIVFGGFLLGRGKVWLDDFKLAVHEADGTWTPIGLENPGFETGNVGEPPSGWSAKSPGYAFSVQQDERFEGARAVRITDEPISIEGGLFAAQPKLDEAIDVELPRGGRAHIPLALLSRNGVTLPQADSAKLDELRKALADVDLQAATAAQQEVRLADVAMAWNVYQHFYPYFDVVKTDWNAVLTELLTRAVKDQTAMQWQETLDWMVAQVQDGHGAVRQRSGTAKRAPLPFVTEWIEGKAVVVAAQPGIAVQVGDVVRSIDGKPADALLKEEERRHSGSPQWRRYIALRQIGMGPVASQAQLVIDRDGKKAEVQVVRSSSDELKEARPANFSEVGPGILYVDLGTADIKVIEERIQDLAAARGVIFDLRGYPNGNHDVLRHLTAQPIQSAQWQVPQTIYPDRQRLVGYETRGRWNLEPKEPRIKGKVVFLTDGRAISYAESVMGIVEAYHLGEIVGETTAGTNGNVNSFAIPGGFQISWTGMRVLKHDGSQHHLVGIKPTVPAKRTLAGVRAGRDEVIEKGVAVIEEVK